MRRNMGNTIEKGRRIMRKHERRDLYTREIEELAQRAIEKGGSANNALYTAISEAFYAGVAVGNGIIADKVQKTDCISYYKACKELNVPLETFVEGL